MIADIARDRKSTDQKIADIAVIADIARDRKGTDQKIADIARHQKSKKLTAD
ncbi:MAG TPA: hypothetical protein VJW20_24885 [Candidatus Angelobacter sp.]|nr:hypothetical protein [Candidatus Angelobacter sp.]